MEKTTKGRAERSAKVEQLKAIFEANQGGVLTDFCGLDVAGISELRSRFREQSVIYHVVKNTLTRLAIKGTSYEGLTEFLSGPTAIAFCETDAIVAARIAVDFAKEYGVFEIKGGFMDGGVLSAAEVGELSTFGDKEQLLARVLSVINGPSRRFLEVLNGAPQKFLGVLKARVEQMEEGA